MKNLFRNLLLLTSIFSLVILFSCGEDDPEEVAPAVPSVSVTVTVNGVATTDDPVALQPGDSLGFDVSVTAEGGFNTLRVMYSVDGGTATTFAERTRTDLGVEAGTTSVSDILMSTKIESDLVGSEISFEFIGVDDYETGQSGSTTVDVEVNSPEARVYSAVLLAAPLGDLSAESFFSTSDGEIYSPDEVIASSESVSPTIDFGYYYGVTNMASIASPAGFETTVFSAQVENWDAKNATIIKSTTLDASAFAEVTTYADIDEVFAAGTDEEGIITGLSPDVAGKTVVAFETVSGKRGLILVKAIVDGDQDGEFDGEDDRIELDILVQEDAE